MLPTYFAWGIYIGSSISEHGGELDGDDSGPCTRAAAEQVTVRKKPCLVSGTAEVPGWN